MCLGWVGPWWTTPTYPAYIAGAGHHGSTFFEHAGFINDIESGTSTGPAIEDAFWAIATGAAAQASIEQRAAVDLVDLMPDGFMEMVQGTLAQSRYEHVAFFGMRLSPTFFSISPKRSPTASSSRASQL